MTAYLAPGVFVEEQNFRPASIAGLSTSVAAMVGPTRFGPIRGRPLLLTSYTDYQTYFGDALDLSLGGSPATNHTAYAARAFFDNNGTQLYLARIANDVLNEGAAADRPATASLVIAAGGTNLLTLTARFPGAGGNLDLVLQPRRSQKLLALATASVTDTALLTLSAVPGAAIIGNVLPNTAFPLQKLTAIGTHQPANGGPERYDFAPNTRITYVDASGASQTVPVASVGTAVAATAVPAGSPQAVNLRALPGADAATLYSIPVGTAMRALFSLPATTTVLYGTVSAGIVTLKKTLNPALAADTTAPLAALATGTRPGDGNLFYDTYDIAVQSNGLVIYRFAAVDLQQGSGNDLATALTASPAGDARNAQPVAATYTGSVASADLWGALLAAFDPAALAPANPATAPAFVLHLTGGTDGAAPQTADYAGQVDEINGDFGLAAFESIDEISIVLCPAAAADPSILEGVVLEIQKHCTRMLYRVGVIDPPRNSAVADVQAFRAQFSDTRLALYYPWVEAASLAPGGGSVFLPPSGFVAGVYANTDLTRGVHKAPANEVVLGALALEIYVNTAQQEVLNPLGINCIRFFPNRGIRVWGGRTLSDDPNWQFVNVRRYFLYLEHSIAHATNWVVFEPNGPDLWSSIAASVGDFLYNEWANRRLFGARPENAYFVRCDSTTMTQNDLDNGRLVCVIGAAPLEPAEFVIFRIGQMTASA